MQRTGNKSWPGENDMVPRTLRFSNHVVKVGMKTTGKGSPAAREPIGSRTRNTSEITEDNTVKTTGNRSTNIGDVIMPRIRHSSGKDFVTKNKENRSEYRAFCMWPGTKSLENIMEQCTMCYKENRVSGGM